MEAGRYCISGTLPITVGVSQFSVLDHFFFLVYINDFANCFEDAQLVLYADDAVSINKSTTLGLGKNTNKSERGDRMDEK